MEKSKSRYNNWQLKLDEDNLLWLTFDRKDSRVNTINEEVLHELETILDNLKNQQPKALIIRSGKKSGFIAGADIVRIQSFTTAEEILEFLRYGQSVFNKLESLEIPTIAMIDGYCFGGGLELSLACQYRLAENSAKTKLALPEVKLGILPGWGGTVRLPRLIGVFNAMDLILTGRAVSAKSAQKMGIVDEAPPRRLLEKAARDYALNPPKRKNTLTQTINKVTEIPFARTLISKLLENRLRAKVNPKHYPSPYCVVENWVEAGLSLQKGLELEANSIGKLMLSDTPRNLVRVFFLSENLKSLGKSTDFTPNHVHVIGAGVMGGDIAAYCALKGLKVTLQDQTSTLIAKAVKRAFELAKKQLKEPYLIQQVMDRLIPDVHGEGIKHADLIIEAITEKLSAKQELFAHVEKTAKKQAIFATNTSTIPLEEIGAVLNNPERLVGIHFFNPVPKMPLVEVVYGQNTDKTVFNNAMAFVHQIDKLPLPVKSSPGFLVNRILLPYMLEAITLLEEGNSPEIVDQAALDFGLPMGPIELADVVGLDVCLAALEKLQGELKGTMSQKLKQKVTQGELGRKTGKGFYQYKNGKAVKSKENLNNIPSDITNRLILRLLNEAVACLREGIVDSSDHLDAGCIFGFGFPPFRGGPIAYVRYQGEARLLKLLEEFESRYGNRFSADKGWDRKDLCA